MTFTDITNEVQDSLARSDTVVTGKIATWVNRRQRIATRRHNFAFMRTETTITVTAAKQTYTSADGFPTDFKQLVVPYLSKSGSYTTLDVRSEQEMRDRFGPTDSGEPRAITIIPGTTTLLVWPPSPDTTYTLKLAYFQFPAALSGTGTNWLTDNAEDLLITGGKAEGLWFLGADEEATEEEQKFERAYQDAIRVDSLHQLQDVFQIEPRWTSRGTSTARRQAGWPWF